MSEPANTSKTVKHSKTRPTASEADRLRWRRQKAAQRLRRETGSYYVQTPLPRSTVDKLKTFVRVYDTDNLADPATAADVLLAAIEQGAEYRERALKAEKRVIDLGGKLDN